MKLLVCLFFFAALVFPVSAFASFTPEDLALRYEPKLLFDSSSRWRPLSVDRYLFSGRNFVCSRAGSAGRKEDKQARGCKKLESSSQLEKFWSEDAVLDLDGRGGRVDAGAHLPELGPRKQALYWHAVSKEGKTFVSYWWFLRFNDVLGGKATEKASISSGHGPLFHESDWEGITVAIDPSAPRMLWVGYSAHGTLWRYLPGVSICSRTWDKNGCTHPKVFVANKSNAAYPFACSFSAFRPCKQTISSGSSSFPLLEGGYDGKRPWSGSLLEMRSQSWLFWPGNWNYTTKPLIESPGVRALFADPWSEDQCTARGSDDRCPREAPISPCASFAGPGVASLRCRPALIEQMPKGAVVQNMNSEIKEAEKLPFDVSGGDEVWIKSGGRSYRFVVPWSQKESNAQFRDGKLCLEGLCLFPSALRGADKTNW